MPLSRQDMVAFLRTRRYCVQASIAGDGAPQAAVVGFAVSDELELVFDTLETTRKAINLRRDPRIALVVGAGEDERTAQVQGIADEPTGAELARIKAVYFTAFPDGPTRENWPHITYFRVRPTLIKYSDFGATGDPRIEEHRFPHPPGRR